MSTSIMWFRRDLRLGDNPALTAAAASGAVVPAFVWPETGDRRVGAVSRCWLDRSLAALDADMRESRSHLVTRHGPTSEALCALAEECGAGRVFATRDWTPEGRAEEYDVSRALAERGVRLELAEGSLLVAPDALATATGRPYRVFTPFHRAWRSAIDESTPLRRPAVRRPRALPASAETVPSPPDGPDLSHAWEPGEAGARRRLERFLRDALADYEVDRDRPDLRGTSELSPHLSWGEISPRTVFSACVGAAGDAAEPYLRQLGWREFSAHVLHHFPHTAAASMRPEFEAMPWASDPAGVEAWKAGRTGYPLVDAGMRQLAQTGWMHNRVRLVAASLLTKHLLIDWRIGEAHFRDALADLDLASNVFNWQWVAGSGADAAPYFRVFNPAVQGARFDPDGAYVRRWVPELARLDARWIHRPFSAPDEALAQAGVWLGETYPQPVIEHAEGRERALAAFAEVRARATRRG